MDGTDLWRCYLNGCTEDGRLNVASRPGRSSTHRGDGLARSRSIGTAFRRAFCPGRSPSSRWRLAATAIAAVLGLSLLVVPTYTRADRETPVAEPKPVRELDWSDPALKAEVKRRASDEAETTEVKSYPERDSDEPGPPPRPEFSADQIGEMRDAAEDRRRWRADPDREQARESSEARYRDLDRAEALEVAKDEQGQFIDQPPWKPLDLQPGDRVRSFPSDNSALIDQGEPGADAKPVLAESSVPMRSDVGSGKEKLVDLSLQREGDQFEPANPLVDTTIEDEAGEGVRLSDVRVSAASSADRPAEVADKIFFANADSRAGQSADTDLVVTPQPQGVQFAWHLRSRASLDNPQALDFALPTGATLKSEPKSGGAEIVRDSKRLLTVQPPAAWDADGELVPASYSVNGERLTVKIDDPDGDWAYPLVLDPTIDDADQLDAAGNPSGCGNFTSNGWAFYQKPTNRSSLSWLEYCGLHVWANHDRLYNNGDQGHWYRTAFRRSYINAAAFRLSHTPANTCAYEGIYDYEYPNGAPKNAWNIGTWIHPAGYNPPSGESPWWLPQGDAGATNYRGNPCATLGQNGKTHYANSPGKSNAMVAGMTVYGGSGSVDPMVSLNGSIIYQGDYDTPGTTVTHSGLPTGWTKRATPSVTVRGKEPDPGLGVKNLTLFVPATRNGNFFSTFNLQMATKACSGGYNSRCLAEDANSFTYDTGVEGQDAAMPNGVNVVTAGSIDVLGKQAPAANLPSWQIKVDRLAPTFVGDLTGSLKANEGKGLYNPEYTLGFTASDPHSGIKKAQLLIDGQPSSKPEHTKTFSCLNGQCPADAQSHSFSITTDNYSDGQHSFAVRLTDQLDTSRDSAPVQATVDRRGDIYTARETERTPEDDDVAVLERARLGTYTARREDGADISTRNSVACTQNPASLCGEVRKRDSVSDDGQQTELFSSYKGTSEADQRLEDVTAFTKVTHEQLGTPTETGPIAEALSSGQTPPPAHGATFELYQTQDQVVLEGSTVTEVRRRWVDASTKLLLRQQVQVGNDTESDAVYSYDLDRKLASELPQDTFAVSKQAGQTEGETVDYASGASRPPADPTPDPTLDEEVDRARELREQFGLSVDEDLIRSTLGDSSLAKSADDFGVPITNPEQDQITTLDSVLEAGENIENLTNSSSFAGYWPDYSTGVLHVAFTGNVQTNLDSLKAQFPFPSRLVGEAATQTLNSLQSLTTQLEADWDQLVADGVPVSGVRLDEENNRVELAADQVDNADRQLISSRYGSGVYLIEELPASDIADRTNWPTMKAGLEIDGSQSCTSGYTVKAHGRYYTTTAGHCGRRVGTEFYRRDFILGNMKRRSLTPYDYGLIQIRRSERTANILLRPRGGQRYQPVKSLGRAAQHRRYCYVGQEYADVRCGTGGRGLETRDSCVDPRNRTGCHRIRVARVLLRGNNRALDGDSGGPVFYNSHAVGIAVSVRFDRRYMYYTPMSTILDRTNTRLVTRR